MMYNVGIDSFWKKLALSQVDDPVLTIYSDLEPVDSGKQIDGSPYTPVVSRSEVVMPENNPTGSEQLVSPVYVGPGRVKVMTCVYLDQIPQNAPLAEFIEAVSGGEW